MANGKDSGHIEERTSLYSLPNEVPSFHPFGTQFWMIEDQMKRHFYAAD
jgi:hypothetical protein